MLPVLADIDERAVKRVLSLHPSISIAVMRPTGVAWVDDGDTGGPASVEPMRRTTTPKRVAIGSS